MRVCTFVIQMEKKCVHIDWLDDDLEHAITVYVP